MNANRNDRQQPNVVGFNWLKGSLSAYSPLPAELAAMIDDFLIFIPMGMVVAGERFRRLGAGGGKLLGSGLRLALNMERCWRFNGNDLIQVPLAEPEKGAGCHLVS